MKKIPAIPKEYEELGRRLYILIDENPEKAVEEARSISSTGTADGVLLAQLKASVLVDGGSIARDKAAVAEGIQLFKGLLEKRPKRADLHYNLANGLVAVADLEHRVGFDWYLRTAVTRREARGHFQDAALLKDAEGVKAMALTNLGNALWSAHRWVEAYDAYKRALDADTTNSVALTGAAKVLLRCVDFGIGDRKTLLSVAARLLESARKYPERLRELAGLRAYESLAKLLAHKLKGGQPPDLSGASEYERFVASHRLALSPTIEGLSPSLKRWDSLVIESISEPTDSPGSIPAIFAMFNVMKSDFLAARFLAYQGLRDAIPESGFYADTLDYALYGVRPAILTLAQRACIDILDKIAAATTEYFGIQESTDHIYFTNRWFAKQGKNQILQWHPELRGHIEKGNTAIIALAELSLDVKEGGFLSVKKSLRNASTHRFTVLHDVGCQPSRQSSLVEHREANVFESHLLESLQLVRAALLYFVEMISRGERVRRDSLGGAVVPLSVPSHHWIRGESSD